MAELTAVPPGLPSFTDLILRRILDVAELCPYPTLEWLATQVSELHPYLDKSLLSRILIYNT